MLPGIENQSSNCPNPFDQLRHASATRAAEYEERIMRIAREREAAADRASILAKALSAIATMRIGYSTVGMEAVQIAEEALREVGLNQAADKTLLLFREVGGYSPAEQAKGLNRILADIGA